MGVVEFTPLKPLFMSTYQSARVYLAGAAALPPLPLHLRRNPESSSALRDVLPAQARSIQTLTANELQDAYRAVSGNKLTDAQKVFRTILHQLLFIVASSEAEAAEVSLTLCKQKRATRTRS